MGRIGCTSNGNQNDSKFSEPMPWIGMYIVVASAACAMAMAVDAIHGFRYRKLWFPCKFFSLNATTLTLVGVAIKLSVDLNTPMPRQQDQLAKLSSVVFICTVMGNSMPSIGTMENTEMMVNVVALGILVVTTIVNICIQLGTSVIYVFWKEHIFVMFLTLVLLAILCSSALAVPSTKCYLDIKYSQKHRIAVKECFDKTDISKIERLKEGLVKYWMMAYTSSPQFVLGHSATCIASGAFCLMSALTLAEALLRSYLMPWSFKFCRGESDYKWSTTLVLVTQTIAVAVGTIAPAIRWFIAINFRCPKKANKALKPFFKVENYWTQVLVELKECPLTSIISSRQGRRIAHYAKSQILGFCIKMQIAIVSMSKSVQLISIFCVSRFLIKCHNNGSSNDIETESELSPNPNLARFVMHLEGEEELVDLVMQNNCNATDRWIRIGEKQQPKYLTQFLEKFNSSQEFKGVIEFDSDEVPSLNPEEPPNCWALPVATLTSIAVSLPNISNSSTKQLINSVNEGLILVGVVENNLDNKHEFLNLRKAAEIVWQSVDLYFKWLDVDLHQFTLQEKSPQETLNGLADIAEKKLVEFKRRDIYQCLRDSPSKLPIKVLAANSMYRISRSILMDYESRDCQSSERLFEYLSFMISDILSACLTNLGHIMTMKCHCTAIEQREEGVRSAILLLGKTEKILKILEQKPLPASDPDQLSYIDDWRLLIKQKGYMHATSSEDNFAALFSSSDLTLSIK
ncbi:hypothetical protein LguiA_015487 [Lonicera macranthoides]